MKKQWRFGRALPPLRLRLGAAVGVALVIALPSCIDMGIGTCTPADSSANWFIYGGLTRSQLIDPEVRPGVEARLRVGEQLALDIDTIGESFCGINPTSTYHSTDAAIVRLNGGLLTAVAPGRAHISATVRYAGRTSEAFLHWCLPPPGGGPASPFPGNQCTWIPVDGITVVP